MSGPRALNWRSKQKGANVFGDRVKQARVRAGMTTAILADTLGVDLASISAWENRHVYPHVLNLKPLAQVLGVTVDWLLSTDDK